MKNTIFFLLFFLNHWLWAQEGLIGEYYNGINFDKKVLTRTDANIDFGWWGTGPKDGVVNDEYYSIRWTGKLLAPETGKYQFSAKFDDGIRLWVNDVPMLNAWGLHNMGEYSNFIMLEKGKTYAIKLEFFNAMREGEIQLLWKTPSMLNNWFGSEYSTVPAKQFFQPDPQENDKSKPIITSKSVTPPIGSKTKTPNTKSITPSVAKPKTTVKPINTFEKYDTDLDIKQVFFIKSVDKMTDNSIERLEKVVLFLKNNIKSKIELKGHTDVLGDAELNRQLSVSRAKVVSDFLLNKGIPENRISYQGFGSTQPLIAEPKTEEERAVNRRVEFVIK